MNGIGPPLVTPFDQSGALDTDRLAELVHWFEDRGVDFLIPGGSTGETELMSADERARVVSVVAAEASVPVIAGTGHPGFQGTVRQTERAADDEVEGAIVVTPFYYNHDAAALIAYYRDVADAVPLPVFLYSVPKFTGITLTPETVAEIADHDNIAGMKDSSGDLNAFQRIRRRVPASFDLFMGSGGIFAPALDAGADGGVLALANIAPERTTEAYAHHRAGDDDAAREINRDLVELNHAVTGRFGIPGLKAAMRMRGAPAGYSRRPHRPVDEDDRAVIEALVAAAEP